MKYKLANITLAAFVMMAVTLTARAADEADLKTEVNNAIARFKEADPGISTLFQTSAGYAVFPSVGKGGLVIGGAHGKGLVFEKGKAVGEVTLTEASIGAQVGGQVFSEVIFFETPAVLEDFKTGKFTMDATINGVVAAEGVEKSAKFQNGVEVFVLPKTGLMGQAAVGGQRFKFRPLTQQ
ncbi:lipid-binding SYLF domain-containing protein [Pedosphaera parvula]|nr:lipid-binding SYLF domain-containing protein [Pedosphaera parvula]